MDIASRHHKTPAQVLLRWNVQRGVVVIPKSTKPERVCENYNVFDFTLDNNEMDSMSAMHKEHTMRLYEPWNTWEVPLFH